MKRTSAVAIALGAMLMAGAASADLPPGQEVQAPRAQQMQAPRGQEVQAPRGGQILMPRD